MKITFLGTGTSTGVPQIGCKCKVCQSAHPHDKRLRASAMIEVENKRIVIDAGPDFRAQMLQHKVDSIDAILITHEHYDHVGGIDDVRPFGLVDIYAEQRVLNQIKTVMPYCFSTSRYPGVPKIELHCIDDNAFDIDGLQIQPIRIMHAQLPILGYRIANFAYITDLKTIDESSIAQLQNLDVLVLNALRIEQHISHINLDEAIVLAQKIAARRTYFIHFSHDLGLHSEVERSLPDNIFLSYDGLELEI
jgi:phosphoribosyl 1,2-cyclic phosphate phosphodiesterase